MTAAIDYRDEFMGVPAHMAARLWPKVEPLLRPTIELNSGYNSDDVLAEITEGRMQLWVSFDGADQIMIAWVTQILVYPRRKVLLLLFMGGSELSAYRHHEGYLKEWGAEMGCAEISAVGRKGLVKFFPDAEIKYYVYSERIQP